MSNPTETAATITVTRTAMGGGVTRFHGLGLPRAGLDGDLRSLCATMEDRGYRFAGEDPASNDSDSAEGALPAFVFTRPASV